MEYDLLPTTRVCRYSGFDEPIFIIRILDNKMAEGLDIGTAVRKYYNSWLALRLWLKGRGVPDADDIELIRILHNIA